MKTIVCPECGKEISSKAESCPNCGCPMEPIRRVKGVKNISSNLNYTKKSLLEGERIIGVAEWSRIPVIILMGFVILAVGMTMTSCLPPATPSETGSNGILFGGGMTICVIILILCIVCLILMEHNEFVITNKRVIIKSGVFIRQAFELKIEMLESISVYQGIFGRLFNFGSIRICGIGSSWCIVNSIVNPLKFRQKFYDEIFYKAEIKDK